MKRVRGDCEKGHVKSGQPLNSIGQVVADVAYETNAGPARLNEQLGYAFDAAGNLLWRTNNALVQQFQVNSLNELTTNVNSGTLTVVGSTTSASSSVTVNGASAYRYGDNTFAVPGLPLTNAYTAVGQSTYGASATNTVSVTIATNTGFLYDGNGNLTNDGLRNFAYDDENQLIQVWVASNWMSQFHYDGKMRRRIRKEYAWETNTWVQTNEVHYVYDGNLVIQERDSNNVVLVTYTRGKDLSGSLEGAGGIGGLLARTAAPYGGASSGQSYYHCDGNGNVTVLIDANQGVVAQYLYDAFGNPISKSGLLADANVYRFSSKEWHANSGLAYYLYRYYDPNLQRWPNRDPLGESGDTLLIAYTHEYDSGVTCLLSPQLPRKFTGLAFGFLQFARPRETLAEGANLFEFTVNDPVTLVDIFGENCSNPCRAFACGLACGMACAPLYLVPPPWVGRILGGACMAGCMAYCCSDNPPPLWPTGPVQGPIYGTAPAN